MFSSLRRHLSNRVIASTLAAVVVLALVALTVPALRAQATVETFTTAGSNSWTAPDGVVSVTVECWGAGGGSGAGDNNNSGGGGGGGGGAYASIEVSVTPGNSYDYTVGTSGAGTSGDGGDGGNSTFDSTACVAEGGTGGLSGGNGGTGGTGGLASNSTGDTVFSGGSGANGAVVAASGGGGGSSAGTASAGTDGSGTTGGTAPSEGGDGGDGGTGDGSTGNPGVAPGGGAGGAGDRSGQGQDGSAGADGQIRLTYVADAVAPTPDPMYFTSAPAATTTHTIGMTAVTATDATSTPVEYRFTVTSGGCTAGHFGSGGTDSTWQTATSYYDTGLQANKCYGYEVQARDQAENYAATSTASSTFTRAAAPGGPAYSSVGVTAITLSNDENGNPTGTPDTDFAVYASSTDLRWDSVYVTAAGGTTTSLTWLKDSQIDGLSLTGLFGGTRYDFEAVARNEDGILTATSTQTGTTTLADTFAPTPDPATFATAPDDTSVSAIDMAATTGSDDTPPIEYYFTSDNSTCGVDAGTGGTDSGWQESDTTYEDTGLQTNQCYGYTVTMRDSLGNAGATSSITRAYTAAAVPGVPTLSGETDTTLDITNDANGNPATTTFAVLVASSTPNDATWVGQYVDQNGDPSATPVWMTDTTIDSLTMTGLNFDTTYALEVTARNGDGDVTAASSQGEGTTLQDQTAPTPDPTFETPPQSDSPTAVSATSTAVSDPSTPVEYFFDAVAGSCGANLGSGGTDSTWQTARGYTDSGLAANKCYAYTVTARDSLGNMTAASTASSTYTLAATPGAPSGGVRTQTTMQIINDENGNSLTDPATAFAVQITGSTPSDPTWNNQYVDTDGTPSAGAVWMTDATIEALTITGLATGTIYSIRVKARNEDSEETAFGTTALISTAAEVFQGTRLNGVRLQGSRLR